MAVTKLVLVRHGESQWNKENRFTGWYDVDLSEKGVSEAKAAGKLLKEEGYSFDFAYTSVLKRAIHTLWNVLDELDQAWLPVEKSWKLNERHYGALQGLNKAETAEKYGDEQVKQWRRGFAVTPPGQYKRTLTLLGENTEEGREKFREELNETHQLFKDFVKRMRPSLDIEQVATGEHWYGQQAVEKGLVDEINTSDEVILSLMEGREVVNVRYMQRKRLIDRFTGSAAESADRLLLRWWQRGQKPLM